MGSPRKVNPPASSRRRRLSKGPHPLESPAPDSGMRDYLRVASGVTALLALVIGLAVGLPRWWPQPPPPWETYRERMVEDPDRSRQTGRQVFVYRYQPAEVDRWTRGIRSPALDQDEFRRIAAQAVELLRPPDAARVLLAAAHARPDFAQELAPGIASVLATLSTAVPEERDLRSRLLALFPSASAPVP